eukprot:NODE_50_length_31184_cov_0.705099.p1 type:complete len:860 gc:universal NODE_50_length_31184_cov_0.705099:9155-11734(+)
MFRLDHPIPSIRLRQLEKLHRNIYLDHNIDINFIKKQFSIQFKKLSMEELQLYGQIYQYLKENTEAQFDDMQDPLDFLEAKTGMLIPHKQIYKQPLIFYEDEVIDGTQDEPVLVFPSEFEDPDIIFTFACDNFPIITPNSECDKFLLQLFNYDYYSLIFDIYLCHHKLNLNILKQYMLYINDPYHVYRYLSDLSNKEYIQATNIIFSVLKHVKSEGLLAAIANSASIVNADLLKQSLKYFNLFQYILLHALENNSIEILKYYLIFGNGEHIDCIYQQLHSSHIYEKDLIVYATYMNASNPSIKNYLKNASEMPICIGSIIANQLPITNEYIYIFLFSRDPALRIKAEKSLNYVGILNHDELLEFHHIYKLFLQNQNKKEDDILYLYYQLLNGKIEPEISLIKALMKTNNTVSKKTVHAMIFYYSLKLFKTYLNLSTYINKHFYIYDVALSYKHFTIKPTEFFLKYPIDEYKVLQPFSVDLNYSNEIENVNVEDYKSCSILKHLAPHIHLLSIQSRFLIKVGEILDYIILHANSHSILLLNFIDSIKNNTIIKFLRKRQLQIKWMVPTQLESLINLISLKSHDEQYRYLIKNHSCANDILYILMYQVLFSQPETKYLEMISQQTEGVNIDAFARLAPHVSFYPTYSVVMELIAHQKSNALIKISQSFKNDEILYLLTEKKHYKAAFNMLMKYEKFSGLDNVMDNAPSYLKILYSSKAKYKPNIKSFLLKDILLALKLKLSIPKEEIAKHLEDGNVNSVAAILLQLSFNPDYITLLSKFKAQLSLLYKSQNHVFLIILRNLCFFKVGWPIVQSLLNVCSEEETKYFQILIVDVKMNRVNNSSYYLEHTTRNGIEVIELIKK